MEAWETLALEKVRKAIEHFQSDDKYSPEVVACVEGLEETLIDLFSGPLH